MKRAADACSVEAYGKRLNTGSRVAEAYVGQAGATFGTTRSGAALQIQIQIQIQRYTEQAYTQLAVVQSLALLFSSSSSELANFVEFIYIFSFYYFELASPRFARPLGLVRPE